MAFTVRFIPNDAGNPPGKLADAELIFSAYPLEGLRLQGFAIWERRTGDRRSVTFPARSYSVNGERRSFALLRPVENPTPERGSYTSTDGLRDFLLAAYAEFEKAADAAPVAQS